MGNSMKRGKKKRDQQTYNVNIFKWTLHKDTWGKEKKSQIEPASLSGCKFHKVL